MISVILIIVGLVYYQQGCHPRYGCPNPAVAANVTDNTCDQTIIYDDQLGFNCFVHVRSLDGRYDCHLVDVTGKVDCTNAVAHLRTARKCDRYQTVKYPFGSMIDIHPYQSSCYTSGYAFQAARDGMLLMVVGVLAVVFIDLPIGYLCVTWKPKVSDSEEAESDAYDSEAYESDSDDVETVDSEARDSNSDSDSADVTSVTMK